MGKYTVIYWCRTSDPGCTNGTKTTRNDINQWSQYGDYIRLFAPNKTVLIPKYNLLDMEIIEN